MGSVQDALVGEEGSADIERLYKAQGARMLRSLLAFSGDPEIASDAVAEAFAQALRRGSEIRDLERWLWRAAFKIAGGELKERRRRAPPAKEGSYEMEAPARDLVVALASLSEKQRMAVILHDAAGYPNKEVAAIIGSTTAAVKVHVARARRRLRELPEDEL
jgi:RNA polymerase sigma-70 factor (ECF subfamily)